MRYLGPCRPRDAAGVRANGDHDYHHPDRAAEHDQNHNRKELLRAPGSGTFVMRPTSRQLTFRET